jgi:hypothetical protein
MHQQLWGYKVEDKLYVGVPEQKRLNTAGLEHRKKGLETICASFLSFSKNKSENILEVRAEQQEVR